MEPWKKVVVAVAVAGAAVAVVAVAGYQAGWFSEPRVTSIETSWGNVSAGETELVTAVTVDNPNPFDVTISSLRYAVLLNDVAMARGSDADVTLKHGTTVIDSVSSINMSRVPRWWSSHVHRGESTHIELVYEVKARAGPIKRTRTIHESYGTVDTDILSTLRLSEPREVNVSIDGSTHRLLVATDFAARWDSVTGETTTINTTVDLYNPHDSSITVDAFTCHLGMNDHIVGSGHIDGAITLPPHETTAVTCDAVVNGSDLIQWFTSHLENNETTRYTVDSSATFTYRGEQHTASPVNLTGSFSTDMLD